MRAALRDACVEVGAHLAQHRAERHGLHRRVGVVEAHELEQVVEHAAHALRAGQHKVKVAAGRGRELGRLLALDQAGELDDRVQRFAQIVRGHARKLLQPLVGAAQLGVAAFERVVGGDDVAHVVRQHQHADDLASGVARRRVAHVHRAPAVLRVVESRAVARHLTASACSNRGSTRLR